MIVSLQPCPEYREPGSRWLAALPSHWEVSNLRALTQTLIATLTRFERKIELVREYRTRLVADVVTGKLDVRPATRQLPARPVKDVPASWPDDSAGDMHLEPEAADGKE